MTGAGSPTTDGYLARYVAAAPLSLALSRAVECKVLAKTAMEPPLLDLGCGDGLFARVFFGGSPVEVGVDRDQGDALKAKAAGSYREVVLADCAALPFAGSTFKTILSNSVLEHVADLQATLEECHRAIEPKGKLIVTVPLPEVSDFFFYSTALRRIGAFKSADLYVNWKHRIWRHRQILDEKGWRSAVENAGFRVESILPFNSELTAQLADLLFPLSPPSLVNKRFFGRMVLRPAVVSRILVRALRWAYERDGAGGEKSGTICLVAAKGREAGR